jgi:Na+-translocating ferredoxin:NAD+ oxidoreductase RnfC subunit
MPNITVEDIARSGVVGAGGAGFPTHVKFAAKADTVLINAAECEPLLHKDKEVLRAYADEVLAGLAVGMELSGASRGVVGIKEKYRDVIERLRPKLGPGMEIAPLADAYPAGDEFILVYEVLGRVIPPGGIPLAVGAVVVNVETALNVARADRRPVTEKFLTVAGAVAEPVTLRVPVGVSLAECVAAAGGPTVADANYVVGGVMMGYLEENHDALVDKTTGGVIVLPDDHVVVRRRRQDWKQIVRIGRSACDQCSFCTELCPRWLLGHPIEPHRAMRSLEFNLIGEANVIGTQFCCECNLCSLYSCPENLDPKNVCVASKPVAREMGLVWSGSAESIEPHPLAADRRVPMKRLMSRLGLSDFHNVGPLEGLEMSPRRVVLPLKQHAGAPAVPTIRPGARVSMGDPVAAPASGALGARIHASITGVVRSVDDAVVIEA